MQVRGRIEKLLGAPKGWLPGAALHVLSMGIDRL
jgi:hypothetical protein